MKNIFIYSNSDELSVKTRETLTNKFLQNNINVAEFSEETDMVIAIGGDGNFLRTVKAINFSPVPILGINTGHLGFFAEFMPDEIDRAVELCKTNNFTIQSHKSIKTTVISDEKTIELSPAVNDVFVKNWHSSMIHLDLSIGDSAVEAFNGDGILVSSSAGSTSYNHSLGGSIVDPRLNLLQITAVAPTNNATFRSLTSGMLVPGDEIISLEPGKYEAIIVIDGVEEGFTDIKRIEITLSDKEIQIARLPEYSFWTKVRSKFL